MTSQKPRINRNIVFVVIGISVIALFLSTGQITICGIQHVVIIEDIKTFESNQDPEFCVRIVDKILEFNEQCEPYIEILDCG